MSTIEGTYLEQIVANVREQLAAAPMRGSLVAAIHAARRRGELAVIGEVKRRSPSAGSINEDVDVAAQAHAYAAGGAAGISVLTERDHFHGSIDDLITVAGSVGVPVLCKDFILDERQLDLAAAAGASAVLLIAALHDDSRLSKLIAAAHARGLEVLLEVHDEAELERALALPADAIGINNRDLRSFEVDLATCEHLAPLTAADSRPLVAESGVRTIADAARLRACGVDALLVGEALMRAPEPATLLRQLATAGVLIKLCGMRSIDDMHAAVSAGADAVGIVLVPGAHREVPVAAAASMVAAVEDAAVEVVGVIGGVSPDEALQIAALTGIDALQLVGDDDACRQIADALESSMPLIRTIPVPNDGDVHEIEQLARSWEQRGARVTFDAHVNNGHGGGTGQRIDPQLIHPLLAGAHRGLAGGLAPCNVAEAVRDLRPAMVDVSSGIESHEGCKDPTLMRAFVEAVRR